MNKCKICNNSMQKLFSMGKQPLANKYPASYDNFKDEIQEVMNLFYCDSCNYINIPCQIDRSVFFEDYYYLSSVNAELVDHFQLLANDIKTRNYKFVIDVGSNDGILIKPLKERGVRCLGIDPSENVSALANAAGFETVVGFFDSYTANNIRMKYGRPDLICASSVFTHLEYPNEFFRIADDLLSDEGEILIEVEYLGDIINNLGFERFYFDRPHYYSIRSLKILGDMAGFELVKIEKITAHGGSVRVRFARRNAAPKVDKSVDLMLAKENGSLQTYTIMAQFEVFENECKRLRENLIKFKESGIKVVGYGCPARFSTITNFVEIGEDLLPYVVDDSPLKIGRFSPGKHVPIIPFSSSHDAEVYIVFAYEYINSIKKKIGLKNIYYFKPIPFQKI